MTSENKKIIYGMNHLLISALQEGYRFFESLKLPPRCIFSEKIQIKRSGQIRSSFKKWNKKEFGYEFKYGKFKNLNRTEGLLEDAYWSGYNTCAALRRPFNEKDKIIIKCFRKWLKNK